jgi:S1-C subfamily serine protease
MAGHRLRFILLTVRALCAITVPLFPGVSFGQQPPGDGSFLLVCTFYGESNQGGSAWNRQQSCQLPPDFPLDDLFRQQTAFLSGGGASSNIQSGQIPPGIHLDISGGHYWSVNNPMSLSQPGPDGRRTFTIQTYCGPEPAPGPGCYVKVNVFARKRQTWSPGQAFFGWSSIYARNKGSTILVRVETEGRSPNYGSGVVIDAEGRVLTAKHLLPTSQAIRDKTYLITGLLDWEKPSVDFSASSKLSIEYVSKQVDFAVLKFANMPAKSSPVFFETSIQPAEPVMVLAYPGGSSLSAMTGVASGDATGGKFAINALLGRGSSGGPVFSPSGGLMGIVVQGPASSDPGKLAFFLTSSTILAELPAPSGTSVWPDLPKVKSDHVDSLSLTATPNSAEHLDFRYPVEGLSDQKEGAACCAYTFHSQRGMKITQAHYFSRSTASATVHAQVSISAAGDTVTIRLPAFTRTSGAGFLGYLWTRQLATTAQ